MSSWTAAAAGFAGRPTFTISQDALRKGGVGRLELEPGLRRPRRWYVGHRAMTSPRRVFNLSLCNSPKATHVGEAQEEARGQTGSRGPGWRDKPELRSDFAGRKAEGRGASDKSVAVFYLFSLSTVSRACVMNATEVELLHAQCSARSNLVTILFGNNSRLLPQDA